MHRLLETIDLANPQVVDLERVRAWFPRVTDEELQLIAGFVASYCSSPLARRVAALDDVQTEVQFSFEHDGVLIRGFLDALHRDGDRALVVDYKTNTLAEHSPDEIVEHDYRLQRLVYALACFRSGATRSRSSTISSSAPDAIVATRFTAVTCRSSKPSCRRRSRGSRPATSCQRRATTRAPAARRSTSSAPARGCARRMHHPKPSPLDM